VSLKAIEIRKKMKIASFFSGAGGLDRGFENAGFEIVWANEYDKSIWETYEKNFPKTKLDKRSIVKIEPSDLPDGIDGMIGGPPCQSWSEAGALRGIDDHRGQLFFNYIEMIKAKRPKFFLAENVSGILASRHRPAFVKILESFAELGYNVSYNLLNANDYGVPQDRQRVIIVGYLEEYGKFFKPPEPEKYKPVLLDAIKDLEKNVVPAGDKNRTNTKQKFINHEYMTGGFSTIFLSRNRVRPWNKPSFTIQAGGRHAPIHPQAPEMVTFGVNDKRFVAGKEALYRRLSVRECARIQTFPDEHVFYYTQIADGYKMIGNAVPVNFAHHLAMQIKKDLVESQPLNRKKILAGKVIDGSSYFKFEQNEIEAVMAELC
jgi:DNA (cytosine-5)-methyltransferase 1